MMSTLTLLVQVWITDPASTTVLLTPTPSVAPAGAKLTVRPDRSFQTMEGFGASMTEASAVTLMALPQAERDRVMKLFFDPLDGLGISLLRQPMGASDFARSIYSYDDQAAGKADPTLADFSMDREEQAILPLLRQAKAINPALRFLGSPWSPPAWMKTGGSMLGAEGGVLRPEFYGSYAQYFVKFVQAYAAAGLPVIAVTPQNEMDYGPKAYPGMKWTAPEEAAFVREALGPALKASFPDVKILVYDHNWDRPDLPATMLDDEDTAKWIAGTAWHYYGGDATAMRSFGEDYPDKEQWFTEGGSGRWIGSDKFVGQFSDGITQAVKITANGAKSFIWWNLALDQNNGPVVYPNKDNYGLIKINTVTKKVAEPYRACFYTLGHFSRFVKPGAVRVDLTGGDSSVLGVAFRNPDGSLVAVLANQRDTAQTVTLSSGGQESGVTLPARGAATAVWKP